MTNQQLNQALSKVAGKTCCQCAKPSPASASMRCLFCREKHPRAYSCDLNAIHKLEEGLTDLQWRDYYTALHKATKTDEPASACIDPHTKNFIHASARTKAECILEAMTP